QLLVSQEYGLVGVAPAAPNCGALVQHIASGGASTWPRPLAGCGGGPTRWWLRRTAAGRHVPSSEPSHRAQPLEAHNLARSSPADRRCGSILEVLPGGWAGTSWESQPALLEPGWTRDRRVGVRCGAAGRSS